MQDFVILNNLGVILGLPIDFYLKEIVILYSKLLVE